MRTIGLLGGMSWESTVTYYKARTRLFRFAPWRALDELYIASTSLG